MHRSALRGDDHSLSGFGTGATGTDRSNRESNPNTRFRNTLLGVRNRLSSSAAALLSSAGSTSLSVFVSGRPWALSSILILVANSRRHSERSNSSSSAAKDFPRLDQRNRIRHQCQYCRHPVPSPFGLSSVQKCRLTRPNRRCLPVSVGCRCSEAAHAHLSDLRRRCWGQNWGHAATRESRT